MDTLIEIKNLNLSYANKQVLFDINCKFEKNTITCLIGSSGCGKTTFLKCINKSIEYDDEVSLSGDIIVDGENIKNVKGENIRKKVGIVSQTPAVFMFSIYKNLLYPLDYHTNWDKEKKKKEIIEVLKKVYLYDEIKDDLNKQADKLSGGQKQRLTIARTLLTYPKILLLDEPCSALDIRSQEVIEDLLLELKKDLTIIIVTHNIKEARKLHDNIIFMNDGKIIEEGKNILLSPNSNELKKFLGGE